MYFSSSDDGKKFLEDGRRQSNVPHFNVLEDTDQNGSVYSGNGPKQTNASAYSGKGTLSQSQRDAFGRSARSSGRSRAQVNGASSRDYNSQIQSDERDVLDTMFEEPNRRLSDAERNISEDHWFAHQERIHPSNLRLGIPHPHEQSRLSTEGSFHLSHLEGDSVSEGSDEMEYSSGSDHILPVQRTSEVYLSGPRFTDTSPDARTRSRRTNDIGHRNPSSKHDGLSWQQYKVLATRRKEAQSHTGRMDVEGMNGRSFASSENPFRTSADIHRHEFEGRHEPDDHQERFLLDGLTGHHSPSPLSRSALDTFQSQENPSGDDMKHSRDARMSTLVDCHNEFDPVIDDFEDCEFEQEYMHDGRLQRPHSSKTKIRHPIPSFSQIEEGNARLDLGEFVPPGPTVDGHTSDSQTTSIYSISEFQRAEFHRVSKRTNIQRLQGQRQVANSIISRTNSGDSDVDLSEHRVLNDHSQNHEQVQSMLPAVLEQKQSGAHLTIQSLPPSSSSALDRTASGNTSSLDLKRPRRRKLETEFSNSQTSPSEAMRTSQFAGGDDFLGDATVHDPVLSSLLSSDFMGTSVQEDRRISSRQLQEPDYLSMHQQEGHNSQPNQSETGRSSDVLNNTINNQRTNNTITNQRTNKCQSSFAFYEKL
ncbi:uncharacterized protein LOC115922569 [Strongylocentrotus purpuratus]|uniref:Uncharacterized protein n=1 Tax=Strongylocentrotus purpuratus TaxID=7668 RepID=A0A7M7NNZ9_STRPU|nr:uncharacterized protein LOC115922569 [Strongylocentrotus purpuratus]